MRILKIGTPSSFGPTPAGKRSARRNIYGSLVGYVAGKRFWEFGDGFSKINQENAAAWVAGASLDMAIRGEEFQEVPLDVQMEAAGPFPVEYTEELIEARKYASFILKILSFGGEPTGGLNIVETIKAFNVLSEGNTDDCNIAADLLINVPGIMNYDNRGNWIGSVSNENGWTA